MKEKLVIVLDCGATNVRAVAVSLTGTILAIHKLPNAARPDPNFPTGLIWDIDEIWKKLSECIQAIKESIRSAEILAVTVTTFGVNGAPVDKNGQLLYPVISWQCQRTVSNVDEVHKKIPFVDLYGLSGVHQFNFNTIYSLHWLKENRAEILEEMEGFLFISSLLINKLTGSLVNDMTMAGTSMLTDIRERKISEKILSSLGLPKKFFNVEEPGHLAGEVTREAAGYTGIPEGTPVILGGHDTQFSLLGSGAGENEVILSSGTWEILMTRSGNIDLGRESLEAGLTNELDIMSGMYNSGLQWVASGVIEWIKKNFYGIELSNNSKEVYAAMEKEARKAIPFSGAVKFMPELGSNEGSISGIGMQTSRGQIYLAALEALAEKTKEALQLVEKVGKFKANSMIVAGGGSRNALWNQLRANALDLPLKLVKESETTVMGAAIVAMVARGVYPSLESGSEALARSYDYVYPEKNK